MTVPFDRPTLSLGMAMSTWATRAGWSSPHSQTGEAVLLKQIKEDFSVLLHVYRGYGATWPCLYYIRNFLYSVLYYSRNPCE